MKWSRMVAALGVAIALCGCAAPGGGDEAQRQEALDLLMPSSVNIVEPFTRATSFDGDERADGIELLLQASNALDSPGLMIAGSLRVELYEFLPASGERKGRQLDQWTIELSGKENQQRYWNQVTQMYEFHLGVDVTKVPVAEQYVLAVTFSSPMGQRLTDECVLPFGDAKISPTSSRLGQNHRLTR